MPNFVNKISMKCKESEWKDCIINGKSLNNALIDLGYDLSDLKFYPNKPYLCTFYKQKGKQLGTTSTPFKENREVIEKWDGELFYALCCQQDVIGVVASEFVTNAAGDVFQVHSLDGAWLRHDLPNGKNISFKKSEVKRSSFQELSDYYEKKPLRKETKSEFVIEEIQLEPSPKWPPEPGKEKEWMQDVLIPKIKVESKKDPVMDHVVNTVPSKANLLAASVEVLDDGISIFSKLLDKDELKIPSSMTFPEILNRFADTGIVFWGFVREDEIHCEIRNIRYVAKDHVMFVGDDGTTGFHEIFSDRKTFLNYALSTLK